MKETKELTQLITAFVNSIFQSTDDKDFDFKTDFPNFIDDIMFIQPGVQGLKEVGTEIKTANENEDVPAFESVRNTASNQMLHVPTMPKYHITNIFMGLASVFALGQKKGREQLIDELKTGAVKVDEL